MLRIGANADEDVSLDGPVLALTRIRFRHWWHASVAVLRFRRRYGGIGHGAGLLRGTIALADPWTIVNASIWRDKRSLFRWTGRDDHVADVRWTYRRALETWSALSIVDALSPSGRTWNGAFVPCPSPAWRARRCAARGESWDNRQGRGDVSTETRSRRNAVIIEERATSPGDDDGSGLFARMRSGPRWRLMVAGLLAVALAAGVGLEALAQLGAGPLAPSAPETWVYFAASTSPTDRARQIVTIDVVTGERHAFPTAGPVFDLALSADRRRLFASSDGGRIFVIDAVRGKLERVIHAASPSAIPFIAMLPDSRLIAVLDEPAGSLLEAIDIASGDTRGTLPLDQSVAGRPLVGRDVRVPVAGRQLDGARGTTSNAVLSISLERMAIVDGRVITRPTPVGFSIAYLGTPRRPPVLLASADGVIDFDATTAVLAELTPSAQRRVNLAEVYAQQVPDRLFLSGLWGDAQVVAGGSVAHVCFGQIGASDTNVVRQRYVIPLDTLQPVSVDSECGVFARAGDGRLVLATDDHVAVLDERTGQVTQTLRLDAHVVSAASIVAASDVRSP
jgi:hypothetical protein